MYGIGRGIFGMFPLGWIGGGLCMTLFAALIVLVIVMSVRSGRRHRGDCCSPHSTDGAPHNTDTSNAEQILKERYAKGEIDEATYESMLKKIRE